MPTKKKPTKPRKSTKSKVPAAIVPAPALPVLEDSPIDETAIVNAIKLVGGRLSRVAMGLNLPLHVLKARLKKSPHLRAVLDEVRESELDTVEEQLLEAIKGGNVEAVKFYLRCQGKERGWVERHELTGANGAELQGVVLLPALAEKKV